MRLDFAGNRVRGGKNAIVCHHRLPRKADACGIRDPFNSSSRRDRENSRAASACCLNFWKAMVSPRVPRMGLRDFRPTLPPPGFLPGSVRYGRKSRNPASSWSARLQHVISGGPRIVLGPPEITCGRADPARLRSRTRYGGPGLKRLNSHGYWVWPVPRGIHAARARSTPGRPCPAALIPRQACSQLAPRNHPGDITLFRSMSYHLLGGVACSTRHSCPPAARPAAAIATRPVSRGHPELN